MRTPTTLLERLFFTRNLLERHLGKKVTTGQLGELVAERLGRSPLSAATISQWMSGTQAMSLEAVRAFAEVCGVDPGWLAFGAASRALGPVDGARQAAPVVDEYATAEHASTEHLAAQPRSGTPIKRQSLRSR